MSGGLRSSVKSGLNAKRLAFSTGEIDTVHGIDETITRNFSALQAAADCSDRKKKKEAQEKMLTSSPKKIDSYGTTIRSESPPRDVPSTSAIEGEVLLERFLFKELKTATWNFHRCNKLGEGGFGSVFKGWIDESSSSATKPGTGMLIAVKRINKEGSQGHKEWLTEMYYLGRLRHPNLVTLLGYCLEDDCRLLVYEFMACSSLDSHLYGRDSYLQPLSWIQRIKIALGAAKALAFLHGAEKMVIHRDFKSSNILLDSDYNAKLSDFGFAKDGPIGGRSHISTRVVGSFGYAAPEYVATGHLTGKTDVYGFGVVMLELLSGKRVVNRNLPTKEKNLVVWARPYLTSKRRALKIFDARIEGQYHVTAAHKAANLANQCLLLDYKLRPNMNEVVKALEQLQESSHIEDSGISQNEPCHIPHAKSSKDWRSWISFRPSTARSYIR